MNNQYDGRNGNGYQPIADYKNLRDGHAVTTSTVSDNLKNAKDTVEWFAGKSLYGEKWHMVVIVPWSTEDE